MGCKWIVRIELSRKMIETRQVDPGDADVSELIRELDEYQLSIYPAESNHLDPVEELRREYVFFIGAFQGQKLVGIGAVKRFTDDREEIKYGEIKRVFVRKSHRGKGISRLIMECLEKHLVDQGIQVARLETGIYQPEALALYQRSGYRKRSSFGDYPKHDPLSVFMEKQLG